MNFKTFFLIIGILGSITASQAQKRIGYVLKIDSVMKHQYLGLSSFQNFSNIYSMPFELQSFADEITNSVLGESDIVLVKLEETIYQNYLLEEAKLARKAKKVFRQKWLDKLKQDWNLDAFILVQSSRLDPYQQENIAIEMGRIGFVQGNRQAYIRVYLQMEIQAISPDKVIEIKAKTKFMKKEGFPSLRSKNTRFTEEELLQTEDAYHELIQLQLQEIKDSKNFAKFLKTL